MRRHGIRSWTLGGVTLAVALVGAACGGGDDETTTPPAGDTGSAAGGATVAVTEKDFAIALDPASAGAGAVTFAVTNDGPSVHEFVVFQTDLAPDALPTDGGVVDEESTELSAVDEIEDIAIGATQNLDVDLDAGSYVLICNVPGHYESGMHAAFTVS
jgi:uncharacterized cupredoxin-like copper-binding protein